MMGTIIDGALGQARNPVVTRTVHKPVVAHKRPVAALRKEWNSTNIHASSGAIRGIPAKDARQ